MTETLNQKSAAEYLGISVTSLKSLEDEGKLQRQRNMPYPDENFYHVVFDPPHLLWAGKAGYMRAQYGQLDKITWEEDIKQGFRECLRVLKKNGTLVFKWSESQIPVKEVLKLAPIKPLYGNRRGDTHWIVFVKGVIDGTRAD